MEKVAILTIVAISLFGVLGRLSSYLEKSSATIAAGEQDIKDYREIGAEYERTVAVFQQQLAAAKLRADSAVHQLEDMRDKRDELQQQVEEWKTAYQNECMLTTKQIAAIAEKDARIAELLAIGKAYLYPKTSSSSS